MIYLGEIFISFFILDAWLIKNNGYVGTDAMFLLFCCFYTERDVQSTRDKKHKWRSRVGERRKGKT